VEATERAIIMTRSQHILELYTSYMKTALITAGIGIGIALVYSGFQLLHWGIMVAVIAGITLPLIYLTFLWYSHQRDFHVGKKARSAYRNETVMLRIGRASVKHSVKIKGLKDKKEVERDMEGELILRASSLKRALRSDFATGEQNKALVNSRADDPDTLIKMLLMIRAEKHRLLRIYADAMIDEDKETIERTENKIQILEKQESEIKDSLENTLKNDQKLVNKFEDTESDQPYSTEQKPQPNEKSDPSRSS
jgi:hypothetical protein